MQFFKFNDIIILHAFYQLGSHINNSGHKKIDFYNIYQHGNEPDTYKKMCLYKLEAMVSFKVRLYHGFTII